MEHIISQEDLKGYIATGEGYTLIDVRNKDELIHGMIPTAKHIPLPELQQAFQLDVQSFKEKYGFEELERFTHYPSAASSGCDGNTGRGLRHPLYGQGGVSGVDRRHDQYRFWAGSVASRIYVSGGAGEREL